ncbi:MAG: alpha/beta fold hydrolase [Hyphomicrobiaceae bacterium]
MAEHRLSTILAIDLVEYSALMRQGSDKLLAALNELFQSTVRPQVKAHSGRIAKLMGDGAIVEFNSARSAVLCAAAIQNAMQADPPPYNFSQRLALRMGVHAGDVAVEAGDVFGDGVNIAARLEAAAEPGAVLVSKLVTDLAGSGLPVGFRNEGLHRFKNIDVPLEILSVVLDPDVAHNEPSDATRNEEVRFASSDDGVTLAWTASGEGPPIVKAPAWISRLDLDWRNPYLAHYIKFFSQSHRFIRFDARGNGLSDREIPEMSFEQMVEDLHAVFDAAEVERAPILGISQGCAVAAAFASRYPARVSSIVMIGSYPLGRSKRVSAKDRERASAMQAMMKVGWDDDYPSLRDMIAEMIVPLASLEDRRQFAEDMRETVTPEIMSRYRKVLDDIDVTAILPEIKVPCLVMHCSGDRMHPIEQGRFMAARLPMARFLSYESPNHTPSENDPCWPQMQREIDLFLSENRTDRASVH